MTQLEATTELNEDQIVELEQQRQVLLANLFAANMAAPTEIAAQSSTFQGVTHWEELTCVGFHPRRAELQAVVALKQPHGYSGNLCSAGSSEYVRFFIDWGAGFEDVGLTSFKSHDVASPSGEPIQHMASIALDDEQQRQCCGSPVIPQVRAVLGWNQIPSLDPDELPVFGNHVDADIQLQASWGFQCLAKDGLINLGPQIADTIDLDVDLEPATLEPQAWSQLLETYRDEKVPDHRTVYSAIYPLLDADASTSFANYQPDLQNLAELGIDFEQTLAFLTDSEGGDTTYEELTCVGLDNDADVLGAVIHVKRPAGYSGDLCRGGSKEYVTFWADWSGQGHFERLGTANVAVHDFAGNPGLFYAVFLPFQPPPEQRKGCDEPSVVRIRAILSWDKAASDPERLEAWGNRLDTFVLLRPEAQGGVRPAKLYSAGGVLIRNIDPLSHLAYPSKGVLNTRSCSQPAMDRPFAGSVVISGRIRDTASPSIQSQGTSLYYQVQFSPKGENRWQPVTHAVTYYLDLPGAERLKRHTARSSDGWFPYLEKLHLKEKSVYVYNQHLAVWNTRGLADGDYDLRLAYTWDYPIFLQSRIRTTDVVTIKVDNTGFNVSPAIFATELDPDRARTVDVVVPRGDCLTYVQGETVEGLLRARDDNFWKWTLAVEPHGHAHGQRPSPACRSYGSLTDTGDDGERWSLDTTHIDPCGYAVTLRAYDRAIVDSNGARVHAASKSVGFSVIKP